MKAVRPVIEPCSAKVYCDTSNIKRNPDLFSELKCIAEPRDDDTLLCANMDTVSSIGWDEDGWEGCSSVGSVRIQCPKDHYPCNNLMESTGFTEFHCGLTCDEHGGKRTTCFADSDGDD